MVNTLIDLGIEVNIMNLDLGKKLVLQVYKTKIDIQKIDSSKLDIFDMVRASFLVENKERKSRFFEEIFLLIDINIDIALGIPVFIFSNIEIDFLDYHVY